jgi:SAM-dependent methyltransferase
MPVEWMDVTGLTFNSLLLLEQAQLGWMPVYLHVPEKELAIALRANPAVEWYFRHKCPQLNPWLDKILASHEPCDDPSEIRRAEVAVMQSLTDWLVYVLDPSIYDAQPFLGWDSRELTGLVDLSEKIVADVGAGTGRLALAVAPLARTVFAVEPVGNLRAYLRTQAQAQGLKNVFPVDGLITDIPFPDGFFDVTMGGHVFGDAPEAEWRQLERVTKPGGWVILCPGNNDVEDDRHRFLLSQGCRWARFEEPQDGMKRKYWKRME